MLDVWPGELGVLKEMVVMMFGYGSNWAFWAVGLMWVGTVAFWGLLIWAVYALIGSATRHPGRDHRDDEARHILDQRLAKGEIDTEGYLRVRDLFADDDRNPVGSGGRR